MTQEPALVPALLLVVTTALAALFDLRTGHIPNRVTVGALLGGLAAHAIGGLGAGGLADAALGLLWSVLGAVATGAVPLWLFRHGGVGGGDVKLLAAVGALCGARMGLELELHAFVIAALYVAGRLAVRGQLLRALCAALRLLPRLLRRATSEPPAWAAQLGELRFGPSVLVACCVVLPAQWGGTT